MNPEAAKSATPASEPADSCVMVIFGASGDLTKRKLIPALYNLARDKLLSQEFAVVGFATRDYTTETFRAHLDEAMEEHAAGLDRRVRIWEWLRERIYYVSGSLQDPAAYGRLEAQIKDAAQRTRPRTIISTTSRWRRSSSARSCRQLGAAGMAREAKVAMETAWRRVIIEKPFGRDLDSARALNAEIRKTLDERQIYRIDHYLGKETVQNLMVFRFGNGIFEPIWNRATSTTCRSPRRRRSASRSAAATTTRRARCATWCRTTCSSSSSLTAMEPPISFDADAVRDEQAKVLRRDPASTRRRRCCTRTVRGQYGAGTVGRRSACPPTAPSPTWRPTRTPRPSSR